MPANYPPQLISVMKAYAGDAPVLLLDVVAIDGTSYHWANIPITTTPVYTGTVPAWASKLANPPADYDTYYFPWLLNVTDLQFYRSMQATTATIIVQNVSGNTLARDVATVISAITFEGALFALREYNVAAAAVEFEMHGRLSVNAATESQCEFSADQLFNPSAYDGNPYEYSETCQWRYASPACGDTTDNPCNNTYTTCRQPNRFFGILTEVTQNFAAAPVPVSSQAVQRARAF